MRIRSSLTIDASIPDFAAFIGCNGQVQRVQPSSWFVRPWIVFLDGGNEDREGVGSGAAVVGL